MTDIPKVPSNVRWMSIEEAREMYPEPDAPFKLPTVPPDWDDDDIPVNIYGETDEDDT